MRAKRATNAGEGKIMTSVGHSEQCKKFHKLSYNCRYSVLDTESQSLSKENPSLPSLEKGRSISNDLAIAEQVRNDENRNIPSFNYRHSVLDTESQSLSKGNPFRLSIEKGRSTGKVAFTLAEVLITLGIIGVVAAITIPTLMESHRERVTVTKLTQTYSLLSQAIERMIEDEGRTIQYWGATREERLAKFDELFPKYLDVAKICDNNKRGCVGSGYYKVSNTNTNVMFSNSRSNYAYLLKNGVGIKSTSSGTCQQDLSLQKLVCNEADPYCEHSKPNRSYGTYLHGCLELSVDINGPAGPNRTDIDGFTFEIVQDGIVPMGSPKEVIWTQTFEANCIADNIFYSGRCTAWVIHNKNMDYLKCPKKLGWKKASSCK